MAKPLPIAAVVFPAASRISVLSLASPRSHISAIPPALSAIGPYPSIVSPMQRVLNMPKADRDIPYMSARLKETNIETQMQTTGMNVE
jgi:hypothetical protein